MSREVIFEERDEKKEREDLCMFTNTIISFLRITNDDTVSNEEKLKNLMIVSDNVCKSFGLYKYNQYSKEGEPVYTGGYDCLSGRWYKYKD